MYWRCLWCKTKNQFTHQSCSICGRQVGTHPGSKLARNMRAATPSVLHLTV